LRAPFIAKGFLLESRLNLALGYAKSEPMPTDQTEPLAMEDLEMADPDTPKEGEKRPLTPAAERALAEAAARRAQHDREKNNALEELAGRGGLDPTRYGDWEVNGLTSDF
jgi:hypothetical protein